MRGNKGISLIEVIVVIAIMGIVVAGAGMSVSTISSRNVAKMEDLIQAGTKKAVVTAMSKKGVDGFTILKEEGAYYLEIETGQRTKLGEDPITLSYTFNMEPESETTIYTELTEENPIRIGVSKGSGAFQSIQVGGETGDCFALHISNGKRIVVLEFIPETGKIVKVK